MKTVTALLLLWFPIGSAHANSPIILQITSKGDRPSYTLNTKPYSPDDLEKWMKETILRFGAADAVTIRVDETTSTFALFDALFLLKRSGVMRVEIVRSREEDNSLGPERISLTSDQITSDMLSKSGFSIAPATER